MHIIKCLIEKLKYQNLINFEIHYIKIINKTLK